MYSKQPKTKDTIIQLLSNLANPQEIDMYLKRFVDAGQSHFAIVKVGGAVLDHDLDNLCSSLAFLEQIGLFPIVVHGAGPQLSENLKQAGIESKFIEGQRVTTSAVLKVAKQTFIQQNLKLANRLQTMGVKTCSITSGVFGAQQTSDAELGLVGEVNHIDLGPIKAAIGSGAIPILSSLAETDSGQTLNVNADVATNQLAVAIQPYKIIFLTETGGILSEHGNVISSINLATDYAALMDQPWLSGGMKLKVSQVADMLEQLPKTASVSITKPLNLAKELFTHKGSGTLLRKGESILTHNAVDSLNQEMLTELLETSFDKTLASDYFEKLTLDKAYVTDCYRAAAIVQKPLEVPFLDKFVVSEDAKGEGLGKTVWAHLKKGNPSLFWRSRNHNKINGFYFKQCDGCIKTDTWTVFWYGVNDFEQIGRCVDYALSKPQTLT